MKKLPIGVVVVIGFSVAFGITHLISERRVVTTVTMSTTTAVVPSTWVSTERYSARVDRVEVIFEQADYTHYRLQTNGLVREGDLNTERGYENDPDATVYVLNWQQPVGQQIRYVRLTAEPNHLYYLDNENRRIESSMLTRHE